MLSATDPYSLDVFTMDYSRRDATCRANFDRNLESLAAVAFKNFVGGGHSWRLRGVTDPAKLLPGEL